MSSYTQTTLAPNEQVISINKITKLAYLNAVINGASFGILAGFYEPVLGVSVGLVVTALVAAAVWYSRYTMEFSVTNKKILSKKGLIARNTDELLLKKIEGVDVNQPILGRILGYGSLKITGPGQQVVEFTGIDNPMEVKNQIQSQIA